MSVVLMGIKKGMTRVFNSKGDLIVCTLIYVTPHAVVQCKEQEKEGYRAIQLGFQELSPAKARKQTKPLKGHFAKAKIAPMRHLSETRLDGEQVYEVGQLIGVDEFKEGVFVDVTGTSKGKGFQGVMKRHNFSGGPASHGSGFHRAAGSTGMRSTPGRKLPGGKMAGHMGSERVTVQSLSVVKVDKEKNCLLVKGAIPGAKNGLVYIRAAVKKKGL